MKNVTIKDVAKAAGVSYSTVSRALSGSPEISADTRERILQVCKDMNYTANTVARAADFDFLMSSLILVLHNKFFHFSIFCNEIR